MIGTYVSVREVEATPALLERAAVARHGLSRGRVEGGHAGEIDPLGVPELVAHEVQVRLRGVRVSELGFHRVPELAAHEVQVRLRGVRVSELGFQN